VKSFLVLTENGPLLVMTASSSSTGELLLESLKHKGVEKFIAYEVPVHRLHEYYGLPFEIVAADIERGERLRVLDFDGPHIFHWVAFSELGRPIHSEH